MRTDHLLALSTDTIGRAAHRRADPEAIPTLRADPSTRVIVVHRGRVATDGRQVALESPRVAALVPEADDPGAAWVFLGADEEGAYLALLLADDGDDAVFGYDRPHGDASSGQ